MKKIAFIGAGNMNSAIIAGLINNGYDAAHIIVSNPSAEKRIALAQRYGINQSASNIEASEFADVIVLGVKPFLIAEVCQNITQNLDIDDKCFISVAAGTTMAQIEAALVKPCAVIRTMPNTPSQLGLGVTGLYANRLTTVENKQVTTEIMQSVGIIKWLDREQQIDEIIAISGSGPAYFFLFMEAMEKQALAYGYSAKESRELVQQTALGAAKMVVENDLPIRQLRENVTSKGGTTQAAINTFIEGNLDTLVEKAMNSAINRAKAMAKNS